MPTLPTGDDVNKAREQATQAIGGAVEQARTPFMAALGAGDLATQAMRDALEKVRTRLAERAESAKTGVNELPSDLGELREKLDPAELRKRIDGYTKSAQHLYSSLADRGENTFDRLRSQPQVQRAWSQVETAQERVNTAMGDVREMADEMLGRVSRTTRSAGEKAARATEKGAADAAETVEGAADETAATIRERGARAATATRRTTRKAASTASAARPGTPKGKTTKSGSSQ
jgi:heparin binding hemagglutinin HbhA